MMWHHYCHCEKVVLGNLRGEPCNWCDTPESHPDPTSTPEEFNDYVAKELRAGDRRMDEIVNTVAQIQAEQASAKTLLAANTETITQIKTDTAEMLGVFESWKGAMKVMEMIGKLAKPLGYIVGLGASIAAFWTAMKSGISPK